MLLERLVDEKVRQAGSILEGAVGGKQPLVALDDGIDVGFDEEPARV